MRGRGMLVVAFYATLGLVTLAETLSLVRPLTKGTPLVQTACTISVAGPDVGWLSRAEKSILMGE